MFESLRMNSLNVVENAQLIREQVSSQIEIPYEGANYLIKMVTDTNFLKDTEFYKVYQFTEQTDPLLF